MLEQIISAVQQLDIGYLYLVVFVFAFAENLLPPLPSDVVIVFVGSLVGVQSGSAPLVIAAAAFGSTLGFMVMFWIGEQVEHRVIETGRIRFISVALVQKVESWFRKYGYWVIVANRFLSGTRAVISFCAGASELKLAPTTALSFASSLVYYSILIFLAMSLGERWREIASVMETYGTVVSAVLAAGVLAWALIAWLRRRRSRGTSAAS